MAEAFKEKERLLDVSSLGLLSVVTDSTAMLGVTTASAQIMGRELVAPSYECEDEEFGDYVSSFPCDETVDVCPCPYCDETFPCDNLESHESLIHADKDEWPLEPENPWENEEYPWNGNANTGNGNGSWNSGSNSSYSTGKAAFDKMKADFKSSNYKVYEAEIISEEAIGNAVDVTTKVNTAFGFNDYIAQNIADLSSYDNYLKFAKAMSQLGLVGDFVQSAVILFTKSPEDYSNGDILTLTSAALGFAGLVFTTGPFAAVLGAGSAAVGFVSLFYSRNGIIYYKLSDGNYLKLKPLTT